MKIAVKIFVLLALVTAGCSTQTQTAAKLNFPLPRRAHYTVTDQQFESAKVLLQQHFSADTNQLREIISSPCVCGPGLWHLIKHSPYFSVPPIAKGVTHIPLANGKNQDLPMTILQNEVEAANFRATLADLLSRNGELNFRLPTEREFRTFWEVTPFDAIRDPVVVAGGERYNVIIEFAKDRPFWFEEVKNMSPRQ